MEDIVGEESSTSFPVQTNHCPALFCGSVIRDNLSRHAVGKKKTIAERRKCGETTKSSESLDFDLLARVLPGAGAGLT